MSDFLLQLTAESITVLMYIAVIVAGVFAGMAIRKRKNHQAE